MHKYSIILILNLLLAFAAAAQEIYQRQQPPLFDLLSEQTAASSAERPKIGLVLSGGGARGISHVGVFKGLEKYGVPLDLIVGTSMGSVVGGFYAAGYNASQLEKIIRRIDWDNLFSDETERENLFLGQKLEKDRYLIDIRFDGFRAYLPTSLTSGQKILSILSDRLYGASFQAISDFDFLKIPFRAIATDLISGKRVVLGKGDLAEAINASVAVPLLFAPVTWDDMLLVDGGLRSNFAVDVARSLGMDLVIVIDITSPLRTRNELKAPWEVADQVTTIMMQDQNRKQRLLADIIIKPDLEGIGSTDFNKMDFMVQMGEASIDSSIVQLRELIMGQLENHKKKQFTISAISHLVFDHNGQIGQSDTVKTFTETAPVAVATIRKNVDDLFASGIYNHIRAKLAESGTDTALIYEMHANNRLRAVQFTGNSLISDSTLNSMVTHQRGEIFNSNLVCEDLREIKKFYRLKGYILMRFKTAVFDSLNGNLLVDIDEGRLNKISISGNEKTDGFVIRREFPIGEGDIFNSRLVKDGIKNIYNTQLFEKVSVNVDIQQDRYNLLLKVKEKKYTVLRIGGKIGTERGAQNYLELANENFLGIGSQISLLGRFGESDRGVSLNFRVDRMFETFLTGGFTAYFDRKINIYNKNIMRLGEYEEERRGGTLRVGQQLKKLGQVSIELKIENVQNKQKSGEFDREQNSELRTLTIRSITDKRDRIAFTTDGIYNVWYWESGSEQFFGGQEKFTKAFVNLEGYYTYRLNHTLHVKGIIGIADRTLPFSEYFRIGGMDSFMGLHDYEFSGRQVVMANLEYRYKLPFRILSDAYLGFRYDFGGIWENPDLVLKSEDFFQGSGVWFGIDTFLGPLMAAYGIVTYREASLKKGVFYLSLGYNF